MIDRLRRSLCFYLGLHWWGDERLIDDLFQPVCRICGKGALE